MEIDTVSNKITVLGYMDRRVVIKAVQRTGRRAELLSSSSSSSSYYGLEEQSPRLPRGFRCIIPRCGFRSYLRNNNTNVSGALPPKK